MHSDISFIIHLVIILIAAASGSLIAKKLGQPKLIGQVVGGIIIGPTILALVPQTEFIRNLAEIGVILLMFLAGLETDFEELKKSFKKSSMIAAGGIILPFILGIAGMMLLRAQVDIKEAIFVGVILTATSMGITIQALSELGELKTPFGMSILGAAVIDDILGVIILTVVLGVFGTGNTSVGLLIIKIIAFLILVALVGKFMSRSILNNKTWFSKIKTKYLLASSLVLVFIFALLASDFGMAAIIGAYFGGLILSTTQLKEKLTKEVDKFGTSLFIPVFFVNIGLSVNLQSISKYMYVALLILVVGFLSKLIGSYVGARISGFNNKESLRVGISMIPRAEVTLIIANLGVKQGFIGPDVFTGVIILVVASIIISPWLLKKTAGEKHLVSTSH